MVNRVFTLGIHPERRRPAGATYPCAPQESPGMSKPNPKVVQPSPPVLNTEGFVAETRIADRKLLRTWEAKLASWLKVDPDDLKSRGRLADIHLRLGHIERAMAEARAESDRAAEGR